MHVFRRCVIVTIAFVCISTDRVLAKNTETDRPRIGLALAGGGLSALLILESSDFWKSAAFRSTPLQVPA